MDYRLIILLSGKKGVGTVTYTDIVENCTIKQARRKAYEIRYKLTRYDMVKIETVDNEYVGCVPIIPYYIDSSNKKYQIFPDGSIEPVCRC